jgi:hypothetical protein
MASTPNTPVVMGYRLPKTGQTDLPNRVLFREIILDLSTPDKIDVVYLDHQKATTESISAFVARKTPYPQPSRPKLDEKSSPLDLHCEEDCFVAFMLSGFHNWWFSTDGDCFTTKKDLGEKYSDLVHVTNEGVAYPTGVPIPEGCKLLYFRARCNNSNHQDGFNLRIELDLGDATVGGKLEKRRTQLIIDPDIRFPGGSGG